MRVCARTQVVRRAHPRKLSAYKNVPPNIEFKYMLHNRNFTRTQDLNIRWNIGLYKILSYPIMYRNNIKTLSKSGDFSEIGRFV